MKRARLKIPPAPPESIKTFSAYQRSPLARPLRRKTQVERFQIQIDPVTREGSNEPARIRRHQRFLPIFAAAIA